MRRAIIKITDSCQMRCIYCINSDGSNKSATMSSETIKDIISKFKPLEIEFTGGETTKDFPSLLEAIKEARKQCSFVMINSNLELLNLKKKNNLKRPGYLIFILLFMH